MLKSLIERLILVQSAETARCLQENVLRAPMDADVGAILGWLHTLGPAQTVADLERLAAAHGPRFAPAAWLKEEAKGEGVYA